MALINAIAEAGARVTTAKRRATPLQPMTTLLLGFDGPRFPLLTLAGGRPLLLECPAELRVAAPEVETPVALHASTMPPPPPLVKTRARIDPNHVWQDEPPPPSARERRPEVHIDPRTIFKRRKAPAGTVGPRTRELEPVMIEAAVEATHDHIIVPGNPGFRASEQGAKALLAYLRTAQIMAPKAQRSVGDETFIELLPDAFAHLAFTEGKAPTGAPALLEGTLWFGPKPTPLPFADTSRKSLFRLEITGARYPSVCDAFVARIQQILFLRPEVLTAPHDPARLRVKVPRVASAPIPRFDMQET